jgi:hypothetical protein
LRLGRFVGGIGMSVIRTLALAVSLIVCSLLGFSPARAQGDVDVNISVDVEPPPLPVYDQPPIPDTGYLWVPGYWAWDDNTGYYWVPGTWVLPPEPELLWTPGYWGWDDGVYVFHAGYWAPTIGFYGGVAYGFGYDGVGYEGGYWRGGAFYYNNTVNNFGGVRIVNVYSKTVVVNNVTNVSFNGGAHGTTARATPEQIAAGNQRHFPATAEQTRHAEASAHDPALSLNNNHGHPTIAATARAGEFRGQGVIAAHPGQPVAAVLPQGHRKVAPGGNSKSAKAMPAVQHPAPAIRLIRPSRSIRARPAAARLPATRLPAAGPRSRRKRSLQNRRRRPLRRPPPSRRRCVLLRLRRRRSLHRRRRRSRQPRSARQINQNAEIARQWRIAKGE